MKIIVIMLYETGIQLSTAYGKPRIEKFGEV